MKPNDEKPPLGVIWSKGSWWVMHSGGRWKRFDHHVDAVDEAIRMIEGPGTYQGRDVLVRDHFGELVRTLH